MSDKINQRRKCSNAEPGTFNHECGRPATWIGTKASGYRTGFCCDCKAHGYEARAMVAWERIPAEVAA